MDMMLYVQLYLEFFKIGLFSVGGGLATIPFLQELGEKTNWFTPSALSNMIAVSESTPGPMGINMATFVGYETAGFFGGVLATLGTITPSLIIIMMIAKALTQFRESAVVQGIFYGLRPASAALILSAAVEVGEVAFTTETEFGNVLYPSTVALALGIWGLMYYTKAKSLHPICFLLFSGVMGVLFSM